MSTKCNLVVIGGGPAGYAAAIRAAKLGQSVTLVERDRVGGTCLNRGCIPTKALLHSANLFASRESWEALGVNADAVSFCQDAAYKHKDDTVATLVSGVEALLKANGVNYVKGNAKLCSAHVVDVEGAEIEADYVLIATGSRPAKLKIDGIENALNSDDVLSRPVEGDSVAIVGGGVIGVEFASYFASIGKGVTIVEGAERILPMFSKEISLQLAQTLRKKGVTIYTGAKVSAIQSGGIAFETERGHGAVAADSVVVAIGRVPNIDNLGLENAGVKTERFILVDDNFKTNVDNIYAVGDVVGKIQLAHYAHASAICAVEAMLGKVRSINLDTVPSAVYTSPEIAVVGTTDFEGAKIGKFLMGGNGKSLIEGSNRGFVKIATDERGRVKGAEIFGVNATEIIAECALAVQNGLSAEDIGATIHAHPTVAESVCEAAEDVFGLATHKR